MIDAASASDVRGFAVRPHDLQAFLAALRGLQVITDPRVVQVKSKDYYWYSPILKATLDDRVGDLVVVPRDEEEVLRIARACVRWKAPLTVRGAGTGNYGQAIPLFGGVILETTRLKRMAWPRPGVVRVQPGAKMLTLDLEARRRGWELRMYRRRWVGAPRQPLRRSRRRATGDLVVRPPQRPGGRAPSADRRPVDG